MYLKFSQNPELKEKLLSTGDAIYQKPIHTINSYGIGLNANVAPQAVQDGIVGKEKILQEKP